MMSDQRDPGDETTHVPDATGDERPTRAERFSTFSELFGWELSGLESAVVRHRLRLTAPPLHQQDAREIAEAVKSEVDSVIFAAKEHWAAARREDTDRLVQAIIVAYRSMLLREVR